MLSQRRWDIFFGTALLTLKRFGAPRIYNLIATDSASCTSRIFFGTCLSSSTCSELLELTVTTAWSIWFIRNKTRLGNACQSPHKIIHKARVLLLEYQQAHLRPPLFKDDSDTRWVPPAFPWYKVNVDAAVFSNLGTTGIEVIIRDHEGLGFKIIRNHE